MLIGMTCAIFDAVRRTLLLSAYFPAMGRRSRGRLCSCYSWEVISLHSAAVSVRGRRFENFLAILPSYESGFKLLHLHVHDKVLHLVPVHVPRVFGDVPRS